MHASQAGKYADKYIQQLGELKKSDLSSPEFLFKSY